MLKPTFFVPITKIEDEERMVWGYASTTDLDSQGDRITLEAMKGAIPDYMRFPTVREMHRPSAVGRTLSAVVDDVGLYIGAKIVDDVAWKKVKEQVYTAFSIKGSGTRDGEWITQLELTEISLVDRPANQNAVINVWKRSDPPEEGRRTMPMNLKKFGGAESATEEEAVQFIAKVHGERDGLKAENSTLLEKNSKLTRELAEVKATAAESLELQAKVEKLEKEKAEREEKECTSRMKKLLDSAIAAGKFEAADRGDWEKLFKADEKACERQLSKMKAVVPIGKRVGAGGDSGEQSTFEQCQAVIQKIMTDEKVTEDVAYDKARKRQPRLFAKYDAEHLEIASRGGSAVSDDEE